MDERCAAFSAPLAVRPRSQLVRPHTRRRRARLAVNRLQYHYYLFAILACLFFFCVKHFYSARRSTPSRRCFAVFYFYRAISDARENARRFMKTALGSVLPPRFLDRRRDDDPGATAAVTAAVLCLVFSYAVFVDEKNKKKKKKTKKMAKVNKGFYGRLCFLFWYFANLSRFGTAAGKGRERLHR